jgi:hypothetical protein
MRIKVGLLSALVLVGLTPTALFASTANPPVIASVTQLTSGPYKPGDVITFKVSVSGGEPGIKSVAIGGGCLKGMNLNNNLFWDEKTAEVKGFISQELFTTIITGECESGIKTLGVSVTDKTGVTAVLNDASKYQVNSAYLLPIGEVRPTKSGDAIDLTYIPVPEFDSKKLQSWNLPRVTKAGVPIFWSVSPQSKGCKLDKRFPTDIGGTLTLTGRGLCILSRPDTNDNTNMYFEAPTVATKWKIGSPTNRYIRGDVWVKGKPKYVLCIKGSKSLKYYSPDATCLRGYKEK